MHSKQVLLLAIFGLLASCTPNMNPDLNTGDYLVGLKLDPISALAQQDGTEQNKIAVYDKTVKKIHLFDLDQKQLTSTINVYESHGSTEHFILHDGMGQYIVDMTEGGFAITNRYNQMNVNPVHLIGKPIAAAFRPDLGTLVIHDDAGSIGLLKLNIQGDVLKSWTGGSRLTSASDSTILAGDLLDNNHLIVALSNGQLADIDIEQSLIQKRWIFNLKTTNLPSAKWVTKIPQNVNEVLFYITEDRTKKIYLYDLTTETVIDSYEVEAILEKASKTVNPHLILSSYSDKMIEIVYPENHQLHKIKIPRHDMINMNYVTKSYLNLAQNSLSFVQSNFGYFSIQDNFKKYRLSDMLLISTIDLPAANEITFSDQFLLALLPSKLGHAIVYQPDTKQKFEFQFFNRGNLKKE